MARWIDETVTGLPAPVALAVVLALVALVSIVQHRLGTNVALSLGFLVPLWLAGWRFGSRGAISVAVLCGVGWLGARLLEPGAHQPLLDTWNASARLVVFLTVGGLIARVRLLLIEGRAAARIDGLTGIANGFAFGQAAQAELFRSRRSRRPFTVACIDVDNFKRVNDRAGHHEGDRVLYVVAQTLRECVREVDAVARIGGDEFALLLVETDARGAAIALERVGASLRDLPFPVTFSLGAVTFNVPPADVAELTQAAEEMMYAAKRAGKDAIRLRTYDAPANPGSRVAGRRRMPRPHPSHCRLGTS